MKKTILISAVIATMAMAPSAFSQVRVTNSGQVWIGNYKGLYEAGVNESSSQKPDEGSTLVVMPLSTAPLSGGRVSLGLGGITFGCQSASSGRLELNTKQGMVYKDNGDVIFSYSRITAGDPFFEGLIFNTDITVPSTWTTSDARLKKDINSLSTVTRNRPGQTAFM